MRTNIYCRSAILIVVRQKKITCEAPLGAEVQAQQLFICCNGPEREVGRYADKSCAVIDICYGCNVVARGRIERAEMVNNDCVDGVMEWRVDGSVRFSRYPPMTSAHDADLARGHSLKKGH